MISEANVASFGVVFFLLSQVLRMNIRFQFLFCSLTWQTGETVALKKVALRKLEDGIPNQALREIKALQEIEENQHVSSLWK